MILYSASVLIIHRFGTIDYPVLGTALIYQNFEAFLDFVEDHARQNVAHQSQKISVGKVTINAISSKLFRDGTVKPLQCKQREFLKRR